MPRALAPLVADVMTYRPVTIGPQASLAEAARLFERYEFGVLPVCEDGCLRGMLSRLDLLKPFAGTGGEPAASFDEMLRERVGRVMRRDPQTVAPSLPLGVAIETMIRTGRGSLPVTIGGLLVGIVTRQDVARALCAPQRGALAVSTLAPSCTPAA